MEVCREEEAAREASKGGDRVAGGVKAVLAERKAEVVGGLEKALAEALEGLATRA